MDPPPVRVRLYGVMSVTRRGYLLQTMVAVVFLLGLLTIYGARPEPPPPPVGGPAPPGVDLAAGLFDALPWLVIALAILYLLEVVIVTRRFDQKEREQHRSPARATQLHPH